MNGALGITQSLIVRIGFALLFTAFTSTQFAAGQIRSGNQNSFQSQTITGDNLKNNHMLEKILNEIEYSKKQIEELQKNQKDTKVNRKLIDQSRLIAALLEKMVERIMDPGNVSRNPKIAFVTFVPKINNTNVQNVYWEEFHFVSQTVTEMIEVNKNLNMKYDLADTNTQQNFDRYGMLPDNYIKIPSSIYSHA